MASCEKCWNEAYQMAKDTGKEQVVCYQEMLLKNNGKCTPEEQAGHDADECPICKRKAIHVICKVCMSCGGKKNAYKTICG